MSQWDKKLGQSFLGDSNDRPDMAVLGHLSDQEGTSNLPNKDKDKTMDKLYKLHLTSLSLGQ